MERLLMALLECGSMDLRILDGVGYDLGEIAEEMLRQGITPTLNLITNEIFMKGMRELKEAVEDAIYDRQCMIEDLCGEEQDDSDYRFVQNVEDEIEELKSLDPDEDMGWFCNCLDTHCWLRNKEDYRRYISAAISRIEGNMGFDF